MAMANDERQYIIRAYAEAACARAYEALGVKNAKEFCDLMKIPYVESESLALEDMKDIWRALIEKRLNLEWVFLGIGPQYITDEEMTKELINKKVEAYFSKYCMDLLQ